MRITELVAIALGVGVFILGATAGFNLGRTIGRGEIVQELGRLPAQPADYKLEECQDCELALELCVDALEYTLEDRETPIGWRRLP